MPHFISPIYARYRWDELHPLVGYAFQTVSESLYHTLRSFDDVVRGAPPDSIVPYGTDGHHYTFVQLDSLGHRFIASRIAYERVQRELTLAHAALKPVLPDLWGLKPLSAHDLAMKVLERGSQLVMGWGTGTPGVKFAERWDALLQALEPAGDVDGREVADSMWQEAAYADEKYRAELNSPSKLATALLELLQWERGETQELEALRLDHGGFILIEGQVVTPRSRAQVDLDRMESDAEETRRSIELELRDRARAAAAAVAERLARPAKDYGVSNWQSVLLFVGDWKREAAAAALATVRELRALAGAPLPTATRGKGKRRRRRNPAKNQGLTAKQLQAAQLYAEHKGNESAAAAAMGVARQTFRQHRKAADRKLGTMAVIKPKTVPHQRDRRGQETETEDRRKM